MRTMIAATLAALIGIGVAFADPVNNTPPGNVSGRTLQEATATWVNG